MERTTREKFNELERKVNYSGGKMESDAWMSIEIPRAVSFDPNCFIGLNYSKLSEFVSENLSNSGITDSCSGDLYLHGEVNDLSGKVFIRVEPDARFKTKNQDSTRSYLLQCNFQDKQKKEKEIVSIKPLIDRFVFYLEDIRSYL